MKHAVEAIAADDEYAAVLQFNPTSVQPYLTHRRRDCPDTGLGIEELYAPERLFLVAESTCYEHPAVVEQSAYCAVPPFV
jgi:hypothetical protein